jgi:hypothetical protein
MLGDTFGCPLSIEEIHLSPGANLVNVRKLSATFHTVEQSSRQSEQTKSKRRVHSIVEIGAVEISGMWRNRVMWALPERRFQFLPANPTSYIPIQNSFLLKLVSGTYPAIFG